MRHRTEVCLVCVCERESVCVCIHITCVCVCMCVCVCVCVYLSLSLYICSPTQARQAKTTCIATHKCLQEQKERRLSTSSLSTSCKRTHSIRSDADRKNPPAVGSVITYGYHEMTKDGSSPPVAPRLPRIPCSRIRALSHACARFLEVPVGLASVTASP